jgi:hypothetical protein
LIKLTNAQSRNTGSGAVYVRAFDVREIYAWTVGGGSSRLLLRFSKEKPLDVVETPEEVENLIAAVEARYILPNKR